jgi:tRNA G26 N,N-dimethylase Trm1
MSGNKNSFNQTVSGSVYIGDVSQNNYNNNSFVQQSEQKQTLADAAKEIQQLLKQLEQTNPTATDAEKIAHVNDETTPSFKRRAVGALQAGGEAAIEEFLDNPYVNVGKAIVKGWMKPE